MPKARLSAKGAMIATPWRRPAGTYLGIVSPVGICHEPVSPLVGGGGSLCPPGGDWPGGTRLGVGEPGGCRVPGPASGLLPALPRSAAPSPCRAPGGSAGGVGAPDWNHMEAHLQQIRPGASSSCLAGCAANLWGLSAPPRFPQRMFPGQSTAGLCAKLQPRQPRRKGAHA